jgi:hypothetical protein
VQKVQQIDNYLIMMMRKAMEMKAAPAPQLTTAREILNK